MASRDVENRFLGSLLGLAIGDALGMPVGSMTVEETQEKYGRIDGYLPRDEGTDREIPAGEITDETETTLCIVESMTTNNGQVDTENINARLLHLAEGASQHWMPVDTRDGILAAAENEGVVPDDFNRAPSLATSVIGVPIGLMHSVGGFDEESFRSDLSLVSRLTNASDGQLKLTTAVANGAMDIIRGQPPGAAGDVPSNESPDEIVAELVSDVVSARTFEEVVIEAVNRYRPADSAGAVAGALAGARFGASGIPQWLIDGLEARVYLTLAAPWFYRTATRRAGMVIDLRQT